MKKIISTLLIFGTLLLFASCGKDCEHIDDSPIDGVCDECGEELEPITPGDLPIVPIA